MTIHFALAFASKIVHFCVKNTHQVFNLIRIFSLNWSFLLAKSRYKTNCHQPLAPNKKPVFTIAIYRFDVNTGFLLFILMVYPDDETVEPVSLHFVLPILPNDCAAVPPPPTPQTPLAKSSKTPNKSTFAPNSAAPTKTSSW